MEARRAFQIAVAARREEEERAANMFVDGGPILSPRKTDRSDRHRATQREAIRSEMEALEAQVEACAIDENTYNEKAMALKGRFEALNAPDFLQGPHVATHYQAAREWLRENAPGPYRTMPPFRGLSQRVEEPPEEVD